jgi:hypothetical protein
MLSKLIKHPGLRILFWAVTNDVVFTWTKAALEVIKEKLGSAKAEASKPQGDKDGCHCGKGQEGRCQEEEGN